VVNLTETRKKTYQKNGGSDLSDTELMATAATPHASA
jgi:hypothetical protein